RRLPSGTDARRRHAGSRGGAVPGLRLRRLRLRFPRPARGSRPHDPRRLRRDGAEPRLDRRTSFGASGSSSEGPDRAITLTAQPWADEWVPPPLSPVLGPRPPATRSLTSRHQIPALYVS